MDINHSMSHMAYTAQAISRSLYHNRELVEAVNQACLKSEISCKTSKNQKPVVQIDDLMTTIGRFLKTENDCEEPRAVDGALLHELCNRDRKKVRTNIKRVLNLGLNKQIDRIGRTTVMLQSDNTFHREDEWFEIDLEKAKEFSSYLNPWHDIFKNGAELNRIQEFDPVSKPWL